MIRFILFFFIVSNSLVLKAQNQKVEAVNNYINFTNECIHGMLIVHRLLENFNQEVNKFVDLESHQVNFYSNKDLPQNIFTDPDNWFFEESPETIFQKLNDQTGILDAKYEEGFKKLTRQMYVNIQGINNIRFKAEKIITTLDLNERANQEKIYETLEEGVNLFEDFFKVYQELQSKVDAFEAEYRTIDYKIDFYKTHKVVQTLLENLRYKDDNDWSAQLNQFATHLKASQVRGAVGTKVNNFHNLAIQFFETAAVDEEYKLYGKYYFYHNSQLLNQVNRYGNGYVHSFNQLIGSGSQINLLDIPHFYQVIYPNRWTEDVPLASRDPLIIEIPDRLKNRQIIQREEYLVVDAELVEISLFDHQIIDGDIVSVNFNGDWILEKHPLKGKPYKVNLKLNKEGRNYLMLHAENLGDQPPNTMAVQYSYKGEKKLIVLNSDLKESELIELKIIR